MVGNYIDGKGWEILCDNLGLFVGYVEGSHTPNARTMKPNDEDYVIFCQELYYIDNTYFEYIILIVRTFIYIIFLIRTFSMKYI